MSSWRGPRGIDAYRSVGTRPQDSRPLFYASLWMHGSVSSYSGLRMRWQQRARALWLGLLVRDVTRRRTGQVVGEASSGRDARLHRSRAADQVYRARAICGADGLSADAQNGALSLRLSRSP